MDKNEIIAMTRKYIQWNFLNGSQVTWDSEDVLAPHVTVKQLENFALFITGELLSMKNISEIKLEQMSKILGNIRKEDIIES